MDLLVGFPSFLAFDSRFNNRISTKWYVWLWSSEECGGRWKGKVSLGGKKRRKSWRCKGEEFLYVFRFFLFHHAWWLEGARRIPADKNISIIRVSLGFYLLFKIVSKIRVGGERDYWDGLSREFFKLIKLQRLSRFFHLFDPSSLAWGFIWWLRTQCWAGQKGQKMSAHGDLAKFSLLQSSRGGKCAWWALARWLLKGIPDLW